MPTDGFLSFFHCENNVTTLKKDWSPQNTYCFTILIKLISCLHLNFSIFVYIIVYHGIMAAFYFIKILWNNLINDSPFIQLAVYFEVVCFCVLPNLGSLHPLSLKMFFCTKLFPSGL